MYKRRNLWVMIILQICTFGIYGFYAFYKNLECIYSFSENKGSLFKQRILKWIILFVITFISGVISTILVAVGVLSVGPALFLFAIIGLSVQLIILFMLVKEFDLLGEISNNYGIPTSDVYRYLYAIVTCSTPILSALVFQIRLNTIVSTGKYQKENGIVNHNTFGNYVNNEFNETVVIDEKIVNENNFEETEIINENIEENLNTDVDENKIHGIYLEDIKEVSIEGNCEDSDIRNEDVYSIKDEIEDEI